MRGLKRDSGNARLQIDQRSVFLNLQGVGPFDSVQRGDDVADVWLLTAVLFCHVPHPETMTSQTSLALSDRDHVDGHDRGRASGNRGCDRDDVRPVQNCRTSWVTVVCLNPAIAESPIPQPDIRLAEISHAAQRFGRSFQTPVRMSLQIPFSTLAFRSHHPTVY